jgi:hypothetical protein
MFEFSDPVAKTRMPRYSRINTDGYLMIDLTWRTHARRGERTFDGGLS